MICRGMLTPNTLLFLTANTPVGVTTLHSAFSLFRRGGRVEAEMVTNLTVMRKYCRY